MDGVTSVSLSVVIEQLGWASSDIAGHYIRSGVVTVNDAVVTSETHPVDPRRDDVTVFGLPLQVPRRRGSTATEPIYVLVHNHSRFGIGVFLAQASADDPATLGYCDLPVTNDYLVRFERDLSDHDLLALRQQLCERALLQPQDVTLIRGYDGRTGRYALPRARFRLDQLADSASAVGLELLASASLRCGPYASTALPPGSWRRLLPHEAEALEAMIHSGLPDSTPIEDVWQAMRRIDQATG